MKHRITEHRDGNNDVYYTLEFLRKGIFWGESWQTVIRAPTIHTRVPVRFTTLKEVRNLINSLTVTETIIEEGGSD